MDEQQLAERFPQSYSDSANTPAETRSLHLDDSTEENR